MLGASCVSSLTRKCHVDVRAVDEHRGAGTRCGGGLGPRPPPAASASNKKKEKKKKKRNPKYSIETRVKTKEERHRLGFEFFLLSTPNCFFFYLKNFRKDPKLTFHFQRNQVGSHFGASLICRIFFFAIGSVYGNF